MDRRKSKQIKVVSIIGLILFTTSIIFYFAFIYKPKPPKSKPPSFQPLKIYPVKFIEYENSFDIFGVVENPNQDLSLKKLRYRFLIYGIQNNLIGTTFWRETVLTDLEKKFLVEINFPKPKEPINNISLEIDFNPLDFINKKFETLKIKYYNLKTVDENGNKKLKVTLFNQSILPYENVEAIILLYLNNNLISIAKTIFSINSEETKEVTLSLPKILNKEPDAYEIYFQRTNLLR